MRRNYRNAPASVRDDAAPSREALRPAYEILPVTNREIEQLSGRNPGYTFERSASGELIVSPPNGLKWRRVNEKVSRQFGNWNIKHAHGLVADSRAGFLLPDGSLLYPDAAWFSLRRFLEVSKGDPGRFLPLCPDVVVEILSPSDRHSLTRNKVAEFMRNGARLGMFVDPYRRIVEVSRFDRDVERLENPLRVLLERSYFEGAEADWSVDCVRIFERRPG